MNAKKILAIKMPTALQLMVGMNVIVTRGMMGMASAVQVHH